MKKTVIILLIALFIEKNASAQEYTTHSIIGLKSSFGTLNNPYTNGTLTDFTEKMKATHMIEFGIEGMEKYFYINFKTDFFGIIPDYIVKAINKNNRKQIYGSLMNNFYDEYNKIPQQYDFNASFSDWDVMGGHISFGYKYVFIGGNFAWANTGIDAYQSVSNITIKKQEPANYYGFNERGNFTYGGNIILWNNRTKIPVRLIMAYDLMLMRAYTEKWNGNMGNRIMFDLQAKIPFKKESDKKRGAYVGIIFKQYDIDYSLLVNAVEFTQNFSANITSVKIGYSW